MPEWTNTTVGRVRIEKHLAQGGMAEVYLGTHLTLDRPVAVKVMHAHVEADEDLKSRFQREARVVAALRHPNIVQIYDFDTADGHPYIVMEYIRGPSLAAYLKNLHEHNERMQPAHVARLLGKLASALDHAHEQGVIHRDIKPGNILLHVKSGESRRMFTDQIDPVVTDFGLVRIVNAATQTVSGLVSGTPAYISPEQAQGNKVDHCTDIYSLGVVLYEILAGRVPFDAESTWSVIYKHIHETPPPIPEIQPAVQKIIDRALAKDPRDRYQTCQDMARDYAEAIGIISEATTFPFSQPSTPTSSAASEKKTPLPVPALRRLIPFLGAGVLLLALAGFGLSRLFAAAPGNASPTPTQHSMDTPVTGSGYSDPNVVAPVDSSAPIGLLRFQDGTAAADQVTITTSSMPLPPEGSQYEAWLIQDDNEQRLSLGFIAFDADGKGSLTFVDNRGTNLLGSYHGLEITVEPHPDTNPIPSGKVAFAVTLPDDGLMHIRHLLYSFGSTPNHTGFIRGLSTDTQLLNQLAQKMLAAFQSGDEAVTRSEAEGMLNVIVGDQSPDYKDWDNNGTINDPADGFGLLLNGDNEGYIQGTYSHTDFAVTVPDATENMRLHGGHVEIAATNVGEWSPQLRDQLIAILTASPGGGLEGLIRNAVALANQIEFGVDTNGNEIIEPIPGEGGTSTVYDHSYYMADMLILPQGSANP